MKGRTWLRKSARLVRECVWSFNRRETDKRQRKIGHVSFHGQCSGVSAFRGWWGRFAGERHIAYHVLARRNTEERMKEAG